MTVGNVEDDDNDSNNKNNDDDDKKSWKENDSHDAIARVMC